MGFNPTGPRARPGDRSPTPSVAVESRESALAPVPAGSLDLADANPDDVVEIGELLDGVRNGRTSPDELTLYKSVGAAVQDAAATGWLRAALEQGAGLEVDIQD